MPAVLYVITGFWLVLVEGLPPGNDHDQEFGYSVERSVKVVLEPGSTILGLAEKLATVVAVDTPKSVELELVLIALVILIGPVVAVAGKEAVI